MTGRGGPVRRSMTLVGMLMLLIAAPGTGWTSTESPRGRSVPSATIQVRPRSGPGGTNINVRGTGFFNVACPVVLYYTDANGAYTILDSVDGAKFSVIQQVPEGAAPGPGSVEGSQLHFIPRL